MAQAHSAEKESGPSFPNKSQTMIFRLLARMLYHWATGDSFDMFELRQQNIVGL